ncbi:phage terminase small subunit [Paenibacillus cellulosilyticus]|uniref:Phage terminase small subunit n=1 Tax=Paenibacillus cellulosilyticus TaxID=375489 RepID=A0A2V2YDY5_9BACL|nr:terminase small subunit [Paenibacillus cellulosilyticus]PWV90245.1 phage terminase small subunit [Paenibacillus cellulosilyticus]QKS43403.1 terminase small subunit [Paenibacillus cellulosilyticus]
MTLTPKQAQFVREYLIDLNATQAAIRAGYSVKNAGKIGPELLGKTRIAAAIEKAMNERGKRTEITADRVLQEYAKIGFSNITDYLKVEQKSFEAASGEIKYYNEVELFPTDTVDRKKLDAVAEIKQTKEGIALKLHDKKGALDSIARHLGMFANDKLEINGNVNHNVTHDLKKLSPKELEDLERIIAKTSEP